MIKIFKNFYQILSKINIDLKYLLITQLKFI